MSAKCRLTRTAWRGSDAPKVRPAQTGIRIVSKYPGKWELYEVDPSVTDAERAKWNVPPIAEARKRAEEMNKPSPGDL